MAPVMCARCRRALPDEARFCSTCGAPVPRQDDLVPPAQATPHWVASVLEELGYDVEVRPGQPPVLTATQVGRPDLMIEVRPEERIITVIATLELRRKGRPSDPRFMTTVNAFNGLGVIWRAHILPPTTVAFTTFLTTEPRTSAPAIADFLELAHRELAANLGRSELDRYFG